MRALTRVQCLLAVSTLALLPAQAQEQAAPVNPWSNTSEFSYVSTSGNAESNALGFKDTLIRKWDRSSFEVKAGAVRVASQSGDRVAVGPTVTSYTVVDPPTETTAENYYLNGRFDRTFGKRTFWYAGAGWDRNRPAGTDNRYVGSAGLGTVWADRADHRFRTDCALSYTRQEDVVEAPGVDDTFLGLRLTSKFEHRWADTTTYGNDTTLDGNADETSDFRVDMTNWVAVTMTKRLALKVSLQWLYDNEPALEALRLEDPPGTDTGLTVLEALDELDSTFMASLVIKI